MARETEDVAGSGLRGHRDFNKLWLADAFTQAGNQVTLIAMPLVAVLILDANAFEVGVLVAVEYVGFLVLGLPAGVWVDRRARRPIMIFADISRAAVLLTVPVAYWFDVLTIWQLYGVVLLQGVATLFFDVASMTYVPSLLKAAQMTAGYSRLQADQSVAMVAGPTLAGALVQAATAPFALIVNAVSFIGSAVVVGSIRTNEPRPEQAADHHFGREIAEGMRFVLGHPVLRAIAFSLAVSSFFSAIFAAAVIVFLANDLGASPGIIGLVMSGGGLGGLMGAVLAGRLATALGEKRAVWLPYAVTAPLGLLIPLAGPGPQLVLFALGWFGFSFALVNYNVGQVSLRQRLCPPHMRGRMNATIRFLGWGVMPIGGLIGGGIAVWIGTRDTLWIAQIGHLLVAVILATSLISWKEPNADSVAVLSDAGDHAR